MNFSIESGLTKSIFLIFLSSSLNLVGQLFMKQGMMSSGAISGTLDTIRAAICSPAVVFGIFLQVINTVLWLYVLSRTNLNLALGIATGFFFILMPILTWLYFGERLTAMQWVGMVLTCTGVFFLSVKV